MVVGHERQLSRLASSLPSVSLLVGPPSVGKTAVAFAACQVHHIDGPDRVYRRTLTVDEARDIVRLAATAPHGLLKAFILDLDGASQAAQTTLLKALEESPETSRFLLLATDLPLDTIVSRSEVLRFGLLTEQQVEDVLISRNFKPGDAQRLAQLSKGQVSTALAHLNGNETKLGVLAAVRCLTERDEDALDSLAAKWTDEHTDLLAQLSREVITKRWRIFQHAEAETVTPRLALRLLVALRASIRPRLVVHYSLMSILKES